jgi:hypothetical protein
LYRDKVVGVFVRFFVPLIPKASNTKDFESKIQFISNSSPSISFIENVQVIANKKLTKSNLEKAHLDTLAIKMLNQSKY